MESNNIPGQESGNKDAGETKDPVFPAGMDDPLIYEALHPAGPEDAGKPFSSFRAAGQVIEDAVEGAVNTAVNEAKNHPFRSVAEAGGTVALGVAATVGSPLVAGGAAMILVTGTIAEGVAAVNDTKKGLDKSQQDIEIATHPEKYTAEEIAQANKNIEANLGPGALEAILTTSGVVVAGSNAARLLGRVRIEGSVPGEIPAIAEPIAEAKPTTESHVRIPSFRVVTGADGARRVEMGTIRLQSTTWDAQLYQDVAPSIVQLNCNGYRCTGYAVANRGEDTLIATANHLFKFAPKAAPGQDVDIHIQLADGQTVLGRRFAADPNSDTAIVQAFGIQLNPLQINENRWSTWAPMRAFGYPGRGDTLVMSRGEYLQSWEEDGVCMSNSTVPTLPGFSGGPAIFPDGTVAYTITDGYVGKNSIPGRFDGSFGASVQYVRKLLNSAQEN